MKRTLPQNPQSQLLAIQYQLHKCLYGEKPEQEGWALSNYEDEFFSEDVLLESVTEYARRFMDQNLDPVKIIDGKGSTAEITLRYLRKNVNGWKEYEAKKPFFDEILEKINHSPGAKNYCTQYDYSNLEDYQIPKFLKILRKELEDLDKKAKTLFPELFTKESEWPKKWMLNYKPLREELQKKRGKRFIDIMNHLWEKKLSYNKSQKLLPSLLDKQYKNRFRKLPVTNTKGPEGRRINKHLARKSALIKWKEWTDVESTQWILVQPDPTALAVELGVATITINKDLKRLERAGALIQLGKPGPNDPLIYVIGKKGGTFNDSNGEVQRRGNNALLTEKLRDRLLRSCKSITWPINFQREGLSNSIRHENRHEKYV